MEETAESNATGADAAAEPDKTEPLGGEEIGLDAAPVSGEPGCEYEDRAPAPETAEAAPVANEAAGVQTADAHAPDAAAAVTDQQLKAILEAIVYVAAEPVAPSQIAVATSQPELRIRELLDQLAAEFDDPAHGVMIREVAGGYKIATKPEHHEAVRAFAKSLKPPLKLSLAALETLATIAYKQPITAPEIMEIRGVQGAGVLKTLLDRKLIQTAGRKNVVGRPILYRTTRDFLVQFGLKDLSELPTLKEFEELRRLAINGDEEPAPTEAPPADSEAGNG